MLRWVLLLGCIVIVRIYSFLRSFFRSFLLTVCEIFVGLAQEEWFSVYLRGFGHVHLSSLCSFDEISSFVLNWSFLAFPTVVWIPNPNWCCYPTCMTRGSGFLGQKVSLRICCTTGSRWIILEVNIILEWFDHEYRHVLIICAVLLEPDAEPCHFSISLHPTNTFQFNIYFHCNCSWYFT